MYIHYVQYTFNVTWQTVIVYDCELKDMLIINQNIETDWKDNLGNVRNF